MKTTLKFGKIDRSWHEINAADFTLGRLAVKAARLLQGKQRVDYTPSTDMGDFVVVVNSEKVKLTGKKLQQKEYTRFSGYPGGITRTRLDVLLQTEPEFVVREAVAGMLPKNKLRKFQLRRLKIFKDGNHSFKITPNIK